MIVFELAGEGEERRTDGVEVAHVFEKQHHGYAEAVAVVDEIINILALSEALVERHQRRRAMAEVEARAALAGKLVRGAEKQLGRHRGAPGGGDEQARRERIRLAERGLEVLEMKRLAEMRRRLGVGAEVDPDRGEQLGARGEVEERGMLAEIVAEGPRLGIGVG